MTTQEKVKQLAEQHPNWSARKIADVLGLARTTVIHHYHKCGIHRDRKEMQRLNNTNRDKPLYISEKAEQIILGSILGDGCIEKYRRNDENTKLRLNSQLEITQGHDQKDYLLYKKQLLEEEGVPGKITIRPAELGTRKIKGIPLFAKESYMYETRRSSSFNKYRDLFYKNKKYINRYIYKLKPLGLAIWYMDDGNLFKRTVKLFTNCFTNKDLLILQDMLKRNFNIETTQNKCSSGGKCLYVRTKSLQTFFSLVSPYIPECMNYKNWHLTP